jgi:hypothetical protein
LMGCRTFLISAGGKVMFRPRMEGCRGMACHTLHVTLCMSHSTCHTLHVTLCMSHSAADCVVVCLLTQHSPDGSSLSASVVAQQYGGGGGMAAE